MQIETTPKELLEGAFGSIDAAVLTDVDDDEFGRRIGAVLWQKAYGMSWDEAYRRVGEVMAAAKAERQSNSVG